ncbi:MAG: response regulator [Acidobacteria bacterium]|jgi:DNA-binding NtrC family response regulator|nr:response regulator [Acidobacteriota bacterium]
MTEKVLLVDDEEEFVDTLAERMRNRGMEVSTSNSGKDALDLIDSDSFDVVVLDLQMPGMDGIEVLERIKQRRPDIQVVLLTGHATVEKGVEAMKQGALEFLEKPIDFSKLSEIIHKAKAEKMILVDQDTEERIREIIRGKSW